MYVYIHITICIYIYIYTYIYIHIYTQTYIDYSLIVLIDVVVYMHRGVSRCASADVTHENEDLSCEHLFSQSPLDCGRWGVDVAYLKRGFEIFLNQNSLGRKTCAVFRVTGRLRLELPFRLCASARFWDSYACVYIYIYIYIYCVYTYICIHTHTHVCIYIYIYIYGERERDTYMPRSCIHPRVHACVHPRVASDAHRAVSALLDSVLVMLMRSRLVIVSMVYSVSDVILMCTRWLISHFDVYSVSD